MEAPVPEMREMLPQNKAGGLTLEPDGLSLVPETQVVEGEN